MTRIGLLHSFQRIKKRKKKLNGYLDGTIKTFSKNERTILKFFCTLNMMKEFYRIKGKKKKISLRVFGFYQTVVVDSDSDDSDESEQATASLIAAAFAKIS